MDHQCMAKRCHLIMWKNIVLVERENNSRITHLGNNVKCPNTALYSLLFLPYLIVFRSLESVRRLGHVSFLQICFHDYGLRREEIKSGDL